MSSSSSGPCAQCGKPATTRCGGCLHGQKYVPEDASDVLYCSKECQKKHRPDHKEYCDRILQRRKIFRAGHLLKQAFLTYKEAFYEQEIAGVEIKNGIFTVLRPKGFHQKKGVRGTWGPFPEGVTKNDTEREAALSIEQCDTAIALTGPLCKKILQGWSVRKVHGDIRKPVFRPIFEDGPGAPTSVHVPRLNVHATIAVSHPKSQEEYILDSSGAQFGIREACISHTEYRKRYGGNLSTMMNLGGWTETSDLDAILDGTSRPDLVMAYFSSPDFIADLRLEKRTRVHFKSFIDKREGLDSTMLDGSDADFDKRMNDFVSDLRQHLKAFDFKANEKK